MSGYICNVCKVEYEDRTPFYKVECFDGRYVATCSIECFDIEKNKQIEKAKLRLEQIEKQLPVTDIW